MGKRKITVCTQRWNGLKGEKFTWQNPDHKNDVTFEQFGGWPFTLDPDFTVAAGKDLPCGLTDKPGEYQYLAGPCKTRGNPKTVVIG